MIGFDQYSQIFTKRTMLQDFRLGDLKRTSLQELKYDLKKNIAEKLASLIKNREFDAIDLKSLRKYPRFKKWTLKLISELKKQLNGCEIYRISEKTYNIENLLDNYYGAIIIKNALNADSRIKKLTPIISESELSKIIENFKFLKLNPPIIVKKAKQ